MVLRPEVKVKPRSRGSAISGDRHTSDSPQDQFDVIDIYPTCDHLITV